MNSKKIVTDKFTLDDLPYLNYKMKQNDEDIFKNTIKTMYNYKYNLSKYLYKKYVSDDLTTKKLTNKKLVEIMDKNEYSKFYDVFYNDLSIYKYRSVPLHAIHTFRLHYLFINILNMKIPHKKTILTYKDKNDNFTIAIPITTDNIEEEKNKLHSFMEIFEIYENIENFKFESEKEISRYITLILYKNAAHLWCDDKVKINQIEYEEDVEKKIKQLLIIRIPDFRKPIKSNTKSANKR